MRKNYLIISISIGEALDKIQHPFTIKKKPLSKVEIRTKFLNLIGNIYKRPEANIIPNGENTNPFPPKLGCLLPQPPSTPQCIPKLM